MQHQLKSFFITAYLVATIAISVWAISALLEHGPMIGWIGVLLTTGPIVVLISYMMIARNIPRTTRRLGPVGALAALGVIFAAIDCLQFDGGATVLILSLIGLALFLAYVYWYSEFGPRRSSRIAPGKPLPSFSLLDVEGQMVSSGDFRGSPTVYVFYRGNWCPLCVAQIREIAQHYRELEARGARVALISPQPEAKTRAIAEKFDVPVTFYTDPGANAAKALGIFQPASLPFGMQMLGYRSDGVLPTVIVTDADGIILYTDETDNYRLRPEPQQFLTVLDKGARPDADGAGRDEPVPG